MIAIEPHPEGAVLPVRARAGASRNEIAGEHGGALRVLVTAAPEKGQANRAIITLLAKQFRLAKSACELISGATSPQKRFLVRGITPQALSRLCQSCLEKR